MKNHFLTLAFLGLAIACTQPNTNQLESKEKEPAPAPASSGLSFSFSKQAQSIAPDNWCHVPFAEAAVVNADPANFERRLFTLSEGPHRVAIDYGTNVAAFVLQKKGNLVEVFTSENYPECLSNQVNFTIGNDGTSFRYDNKKLLNFDVKLLILPNGTQIALEMPANSGYGVIVRR